MRPRSLECKGSQVTAFGQRLATRWIARQNPGYRLPSVVRAWPFFLGVVDLRHNLGRFDDGARSLRLELFHRGFSPLKLIIARLSNAPRKKRLIRKLLAEPGDLPGIIMGRLAY